MNALDIRIDTTIMADSRQAVRVVVADVSPLSDANVLTEVVQQLSAHRREKTLECKHPLQRQLSAGAGLALDLLLHPFGLSEKTMSYSFNEHGKPMFKTAPDLHFNLSHSGKMVAAAIMKSDAVSASLGIDIQKMSVFREGVACRVFNSGDIRMLQELSDEDERNHCFTSLWTRYEARVKASGTGIKWNDNDDEDCQDSSLSFNTFQIDDYYITLCVSL